MIKLKIEEIVKASKGSLYKTGGQDKNITLDHVVIDSRKVSEGDFFVPIIGENFDGHNFIEMAMEKGAVLTLCQRNRLDIVDAIDSVTCGVIIVEDALQAFHDIASYVLQKLQIPVVAVTGSVGKTTTKDLLASVLSQGYKVHKNVGNFNNLIGVPLTIFELEDYHQLAVLEMGMDRFGEIQALSHMTQPTCAVITNIGISHIEYLGSRQGILKAKMEIVDGLKEEAHLVVNGDNDLLKTLKANGAYTLIKTGIDKDNDYIARDLKVGNQKTYKFKTALKNLDLECELSIHGKHNVTNAMLAATVGELFGLSKDQIENGLYNYHASGRRMHVYDLNEKVTIINDSYNAATDSMLAGCDVLNDFDEPYKIAILGDMLELGDISHEEHKKVIDYFDVSNAESVYLFGDEMKAGQKLLGRDSKSGHFDSMMSLNQALLEEVTEKTRKGKSVIVYVKGSLGMKMDRVINMLEENNENITNNLK